MRTLAFVRLCLTIWTVALPLLAHAVPANFQNEILITGLTEPTAIAFTPDQRMLIIQRDGRIWVVPAGGTQINPTPFLQITNINIADGERGLVGIAIDPNFATNGFYYVFYTCDSPLRDRVSRFTASGNTTVAGSEFVVWQENIQAATYHHGGAIAFGPDGNLYISIGDHVNSSAVQTLTTYNGKLLRVAPDGTIPTDNPFYDGNGPNRDEIWARGLRNPFRISFDSVTGRLYIDDNGDNDPASSIEEINIGAAGANYGWPICQGNCGTAGMTNPLFSYTHGGRDASITGGLLYRGTQFPVEYRGNYFYGDYVQNWIRRLTLDANGNVTGNVNFEPVNGSADGPYGDIVDIKLGPDGALYYVDIGLSWEGASHPAAVRRIRYTVGNQPPSAQASANPLQGLPPLMVNFSSAGSSDPEGQPLTYSWTFGDGGVSTAANPSYTYANSGTYTARLSVSDGVSTTLSNILTIVAGNPPIPSITSPANNSTFLAGDIISFSGSAFDPDTGNLPPSALTWSVLFLHDNHTHPSLGPVSGVSGGSFNIDPTGHDYRGFTRYLITLTATDPDGVQGTTSVTVFPVKVNLTVDSVPSGLNLTFDGISQVTPFIWDSLVGFQHTLNAPNQMQGGTQYSFTSWSDAGAQIHNITVPAQSQTYTANFQATPQSIVPMIAYGFSENAGGTTADSSGNNRTGTLTNTTWTASGRYGSGLVFNGTSGRVVGPSITLPNTFTIMAWINNPSNQSWETIASVGQDRDLYMENGVLTFESPVPGTVRRFGSALPTNTWNHVAVTSNGTDTRAYLNGNPLGTVQPAVTGSFTAVFQVGAWSYQGSTVDFFSGTMDEVRVYNVALTQAQIQTDMNTAISGAAPAPVPAITSIAPTSASAGGAAFTLTVNGSGFVPASVVRWNGNNRTTTYGSANQLTAAITAADIAAPGSGSVTVFTPAPGGGTSNALTLAINNPAPTTTSISPTSATPGGAQFTLTVNGTGFVNGASVVRVNGANRTTGFNSANQLTATILTGDIAAAGSVSITVLNPAPGGGTSNAQTLAINNPAPATTSLSPNAAVMGGGDFTLTVNGSNFVSGSSVVRWNGSNRTTGFNSANQLTAQIAAADIAAIGGASVTVFTPAPGGGTSNAQTFTITALPNPAPTTTNISPTSALAGGAQFTLTVNGTGFVSGASVVRVNGNDRATGFNSANQLTATILAGDIAAGGSASITVFTAAPGGGTSNAQTLSINNPSPTTTSISPTSALAGGAQFTLTVNGTGFVNGSSVVRVNGNNRTTGFNSANQLTATITAADIAATGSASITVFTPAPGGGTSNAQTLAINNPVPATTGLAPSAIAAGSAGFTLTVNGSNFVNGAVVRWNGSDRVTTPGSANQITAAILAADVLTAGSATVTVFNPAPGGGLSNAQTFSITPPGGAGLVAAYGLNAVSGTAVTDSSGNNNNGTVANGTWTASGRFGSALVFNGTSTIATVADNNSLDLTTAMTLEAWVYPTVQPNGWRTVIVKEQPGNVVYYLNAGSSPANRPATGVFTGGAERILQGGTRLTANTWTHLAATYDGATQRLYVNGMQVSSRAQTGSIATSASALRLGGHSVFGEFFQGRMDEVRIYNRALTQAEIQTDMNTAVP